MGKGLKLAFAAGVLLAAGAGAAFFFDRGVPEEEAPPVTEKLLDELLPQRDHVRLVVGGRLLAEIFPCG